MDTSETDYDRVTISLPPNLIAQIDAQVGAGFVDRKEFIRAVIRFYVDHQQSQLQNSSINQIG